MPEATPPGRSLSGAREATINELSNFFANDDLSLEELERRIERVYKAGSVSELETITADLRSAVTPAAAGQYTRAPLARVGQAPVPSLLPTASGRMLAIMSSTRRVGRWAVPQRLEVTGIMTDARIDFTEAILPPGIVEIDVRMIMASFKIVVPPNMRVINELHSVMSNVRSRADEVLPGDAPATPSAPIIRLTGYALMADVNVVVRRREDARYYDDDDD